MEMRVFEDGIWEQGWKCLGARFLLDYEKVWLICAVVIFFFDPVVPAIVTSCHSQSILQAKLPVWSQTATWTEVNVCFLNLNACI